MGNITLWSLLQGRFSHFTIIIILTVIIILTAVKKTELFDKLSFEVQSVCYYKVQWESTKCTVDQNVTFFKSTYSQSDNDYCYQCKKIIFIFKKVILMNKNLILMHSAAVNLLIS